MVVNREGSLNPMWRRQQSDETREKQSNSQKERWQLIKDKTKTDNQSLNNLASENELDEAIRKAIREEIARLLR